MTATITPVSQHDGATLTRAVAGERMMMDGGASPLATVLQKLADRCEYAKDATAFSRPQWSEEFAVDVGGTNSSFTVTIGAISHVQLYASSTYKVFAYAGGTIGAAKIAGGGNLANSSWYYVYCYNNSGSIDFEITTTAPSASSGRILKTSDSTRVYLGCFRTSSTGAPFPMRMVRGRAAYRRAGITSVTGLFGSDGLRGVDTTGTAAVTALDISSRVPPHARLADIRGAVTATSTGTGGTATLNLYSAGDSTSSSLAIAANASAASGDTSRGSESILLETTSAQLIGYSVSNTTDLVAYSVDVMGWQE